MSNATRVECGVASVSNVTSYTYESATDALEDKMPSYFWPKRLNIFIFSLTKRTNTWAIEMLFFPQKDTHFPSEATLHRFSRTEDCPIAKEEVATAPSAKALADYFHWSIEKIEK